ncbi:MAG: hypothetical protein AUI54_03440 [Acidobacteria bacterium 13_1_40CM_2_56_5]|nr:MAG: hypothetical protein AUI54_03440 [Acidobacteria bacterium 13_1_40CM_2_56_5]
MNIDIALEIVYLAVSLVKTQTGSSLHAAEDLGKTLSEIVRVAAQAYQDQMGRPVDPSFIRSEEPVRQRES